VGWHVPAGVKELLLLDSCSAMHSRVRGVLRTLSRSPRLAPCIRWERGVLRTLSLPSDLRALVWTCSLRCAGGLKVSNALGRVRPTVPSSPPKKRAAHIYIYIYIYMYMCIYAYMHICMIYGAGCFGGLCLLLLPPRVFLPIPTLPIWSGMQFILRTWLGGWVRLFL
jgi:hypothetical protein